VLWISGQQSVTWVGKNKYRYFIKRCALTTMASANFEHTQSNAIRNKGQPRVPRGVAFQTD
jgi:hypothetical protein